MTTTTSHGVPARRSVPPPAAAPGRRTVLTLRGLVAAEWTKFWSIRSLPLLLAALAAVVVLPGLGLAAVAVVQFDGLPGDQRAALDPANDPLGGFQLGLVVAAALGAVSLGGDLGSGAMRTFLTAAPRRGAVLAAKATVVASVTFPVALAALTSTWAAAQLLYSRVGIGLGAGFGGLLPGLLGGAVALAGVALLGLAFAALARQTASAIVLATAVLLVLPGLAGLVPGPAADLVAARLPSTLADRLTQVEPRRPAAESLDALTRRWAVLNPAESKEGGVIVAVRTADGCMLRSAAGHDAGGRALAPDTWTYIGSVTKTYVATALLRLQADGQVDLDAPVRRYVPDAPGAPGLTVRRLLDQTSGLPDYISTPAWRQAVTTDPGRHWTLREVRALVPVGFRPPGRYEYSNTNYLLAGQVLEAVTGTTWQQAVTDRVLRPIGLTHTDTTGAGHPVAYGLVIDDEQRVLPVHPSDYTATETTAGPAGAMAARADDLAAFGHALLTGKALPASQWAQMRRFGVAGGYGLGLADFAVVTRTPDGSSPVHAIGNNGEIPGYGGVLLMYPRSGAVVAVLRNSDRVNGFAVAARLAQGLGLDPDPQQVPPGAAWLLWLGYVTAALAAATWWFRRRNI